MSALTLDLTKKIELSLEKAGVVDVPKLEVRLAVDDSGSMRNEFDEGLVDAIINRFIVAGMKFDDNRSLDVAFFSNNLREAPSALEEDAGDYLRRKFPNRQYGGTNYAPIIEHFETRLAQPTTKKSLFGLGGAKEVQPEGTSKWRGYCAVITDGDNGDKGQFERALSKTSGDTFYEFIAIGREINPTYLARLTEKYKHTHFSHVPSPKTISDQEFYDVLINPKFVAWIG